MPPRHEEIDEEDGGYVSEDTRRGETGVSKSYDASTIPSVRDSRDYDDDLRDSRDYDDDDQRTPPRDNRSSYERMEPQTPMSEIPEAETPYGQRPGDDGYEGPETPYGQRPGDEGYEEPDPETPYGQRPGDEGYVKDEQAENARESEPTASESGPTVSQPAPEAHRPSTDSLRDESAPKTQAKTSGSIQSFAKIQDDNPYLYLSRMGTLSETSKPSLLQTMTKQGKLTLRSVLAPKLTASGLQLQNLTRAPDTQMVADVEASSFKLHVTHARSLPNSGLTQKVIARRLRVCLWDGVHFVGNVGQVDALPLDPAHPTTWSFPATGNEFTIRHTPTSSNQPLKLYLELAVAADPSQDALGLLQQLYAKKTEQVDDVTICWALLPLPSPSVVQSSGGSILPVQLVGGDFTKPAPVTAAPEAKRALWKQLCAVPKSAPTLYVKYAPATAQTPVLRTLPPLMVVRQEEMLLAATWRQLLADRLYSAQGDVITSRMFSPILAVFPRLLEDEHLFAALLTLWSKLAANHAPSKEDLPKRLEALSACVLRLWPLLMLEKFPSPSLASDHHHSAKRVEVLMAYMKQHPNVALSFEANTWISEPFDISELSTKYTDLAAH